MNMQDGPGQSYGASPPAGGFGASGNDGAYGPTGTVPDRTPYVLASVSAFLAAGYWAFLALLTGFNAATGGGSGMTSFMPIVLVVLYVVRGVRVLKGNTRATRSLLFLHGIGLFLAAIALLGGGSVIVAGLHAIKVAIHVFGLVVTYRAKKHMERLPLSLEPMPTT